MDYKSRSPNITNISSILKFLRLMINVEFSNLKGFNIRQIKLDIFLWKMSGAIFHHLQIIMESYVIIIYVKSILDNGYPVGDGVVDDRVP